MFVHNRKNGITQDEIKSDDALFITVANHYVELFSTVHITIQHYLVLSNHPFFLLWNRIHDRSLPWCYRENYFYYYKYKIC